MFNIFFVQKKYHTFALIYKKRLVPITMKNSIHTLDVFDFDRTLCISPENTQENRKIWEQKTGLKWPYKGTGWWSKVETLNHKIFEIKLNDWVAKDALESINDVNRYSVLLTGRMPRFSSSIKEICRLNGLPYFNAYFFNDSKGTLAFKLDKLEQLRKEFPDAKKLNMWEDRKEHIPEFVAWGTANYGSGFKMNIVEVDENSI